MGILKMEEDEKNNVTGEEPLDDEQEGNTEFVSKDEKLKRMKNAEKFKKYLNKTGLPLAFQVIYAEILAKNIEADNVYSYTAMRLRQIGNDILHIKTKKF